MVEVRHKNIGYVTFRCSFVSPMVISKGNISVTRKLYLWKAFCCLATINYRWKKFPNHGTSKDGSYLPFVVNSRNCNTLCSLWSHCPFTNRHIPVWSKLTTSSLGISSISIMHFTLKQKLTFQGFKISRCDLHLGT